MIGGRLVYTVAGILGFLILTIGSIPAGASDWITIPGGPFTMGDLQGDPNEAPSVEKVDAFKIMRYEVTNREFRDFTAATDYVTDAERTGEAYVWTQRWQRDRSANYLQPNGSGSSIEMLDNHPVVQVSAADAAKFCSFYGARLPTEIEWEFAARGTDQRRYPWGNELPQQVAKQALVNFGTDDCCAASSLDGYRTTAPVGSYPDGASPFGVEDLAGNVWEWTATVFPGNASNVVIRGGGWGNDAYCLRVSYRHGNPPDIGLNMVGFRCVR